MLWVILECWPNHSLFCSYCTISWNYGSTLNLSFSQDCSEAFSTAVKETYRKLSSLAISVWTTSHLPRLSGSRYFSSTPRTFCHKFLSMTVHYFVMMIDKRLSSISKPQLNQLQRKVSSSVYFILLDI